MSENDQPRRDLDAAVDDVLPSLTAVSDERVTASLRRTRLALADAAPARQGVGAWRGGLAAAAAAVIVAAAWLALGPSRVSNPDQTVDAVPARTPLVARPILPATAESPAPAPESRRVASGAAARPARRGIGVGSVHTASLPARVTPARRPDPLLALMDAVQAIPDEAWDRGVALVQAPVPVPGVPLEPIAIVPLETPPILDAPAESTAPGEP